MDDLPDTDSEMDSQSSEGSAGGGPSISRHSSASSLCETSQANATLDTKRRTLCVRCRLLGIPCNHRLPSCQACLDSSFECMYLAPTDNDWLFKTLPVGATLGNGSTIPKAWRSSDAWKLLPTSHEFLQENDSGLHAPEDIYSTAENPLRRQQEPRRVDTLMSGQLQEIIGRYPEPLDAAGQAQLPLPSSELLSSISNSISRQEAERLSQQRAPEQQSLSESMSGSSLLALGKPWIFVACSAIRHLIWLTNS
ncbi:hypothetical protein IWW57_004143 [Coemansia sp. S610]|nr:hypothetical protein IWW57_004143 [Coemansia sp. S610]